MNYRGLIQLACFIAGLIVLLVARKEFPAMDNMLGIVLLGTWIVLGIVALIGAYSSPNSSHMPSFYGALPRRWRRWFMGE